MKSLLSVSAVALLVAFAPDPAAANLITGSLWRVSDATAQNAIPANVPARVGDVVFSVNTPLNFVTGNSSATTI